MNQVHRKRGSSRETEAAGEGEARDPRFRLRIRSEARSVERREQRIRLDSRDARYLPYGDEEAARLVRDRLGATTPRADRLCDLRLRQRERRELLAQIAPTIEGE